MSFISEISLFDWPTGILTFSQEASIRFLWIFKELTSSKVSSWVKIGIFLSINLVFTYFDFVGVKVGYFSPWLKLALLFLNLLLRSVLYLLASSIELM